MTKYKEQINYMVEGVNIIIQIEWKNNNEMVFEKKQSVKKLKKKIKIYST